MHVEIDRLARGRRRRGARRRRPAGAARRPRGRRGLDQDARAGQRDRRAGARATRRRSTADEVRQSAELLEWLADGHFTFLGYREYPSSGPRSTGSTTRCCARCPAPAWASCAPTRTSRSRSGGCPSRSRPAPASARCSCWPRPTRAPPCTARPTSTTSASRRSTPTARSTGERRFLGLFSSAAYTESLTAHPAACARRPQAVLQRSGFDPQSHAGKALLDTLETYPRDDLFHTPVEELAPLAEAAMQARERRAVRMFIRHDTYGRYVSVLVYLPRDRYNTSVRERFVEHPAATGSAPSRSSSTCASTSRRPRGCTSSCTCPRARRSPRSTPPTSSAAWPRPRARGATTSPPPSSRSTARRSARSSAGATSTRSPRPTRRTSRRARPRSTSVGSRGSSATRASTTRSTRTLDAGPGEARLKLYRIGPPLSLSEILPMLSSMGVEVVDERPYTLTGLGPPVARLRVRPALRRAPARRGPRPVPGRRPRGLGRLHRDRRLQRARARARLDLAPGDGAARLRQVHAPGRLAVRARLHRGGARRQRRHHPAAGRALRGALRPRRRPTRSVRPAESGLVERLHRALDDVVSLDHDRILRSYLTHVRATLRTNYFQPAGDGGGPKPATSPSSSTRRRSPTCPSRGRSTRSSSTPRGSRACTCASGRSRAGGCAGRTGATTSAPRCWAW